MFGVPIVAPDRKFPDPVLSIACGETSTSPGAYGTASGHNLSCGLPMGRGSKGSWDPSIQPPVSLYSGDQIPGNPFMNPLRLFTVLLLSLAACAPAMSQDRRVPSSPAELRLSYAPIVQRVQPAVVNVFATKVVQNHNPLLDDPIFRRFFGVPGNQPEQMQRSLGSGVMVDPSGLVVTNVHVIEGADQVKVSLSDKREFEAEIVLKDPRSDLAVLKLKNTHEKFPT